MKKQIFNYLFLILCVAIGIVGAVLTANNYKLMISTEDVRVGYVTLFILSILVILASLISSFYFVVKIIERKFEKK